LPLRSRPPLRSTRGRASSRGIRLLLLLAILAVFDSCRRRGQDSVTLLLTEDVFSVDPNRQVESVTDSVLSNVYESLVTLDARLQIRTALADRWENPTPERWRFHLRPGVRFHDGTLLTAQVARDALLALQRNPELEASGYLRLVTRIEAVDESTLDLVTREPRALLPSLLAVYIVRANSAGAFPPLLGTGPFRLVEWRQGKSVLLERWEGYWGVRPAKRRATFLPVPDPRERLARLESREADIAYGMEPVLTTQTMPKDVRLVRAPGITVYYLGFNVRPAPGNSLRDVRVRRAFHLALNRQEIVDKAIRGIGAVATQPVSPLVFGYNVHIRAAPTDPAEARKLLSEAGYGAGLQVRLDFPKPRISTARLIQESLARVGVQIELNPLDRNAVYEIAASGKSDLFFAGWDCTSGEASEFYEFNLHTRIGVHGSGNYGGYTNARLDELADGNAATLDPARRKVLLEEAATIVMNDLPILPLYIEDNLLGVRKEITFTVPADGVIRVAELEVR
jgi:peptide/nickel transport system substrate-binding protein